LISSTFTSTSPGKNRKRVFPVRLREKFCTGG
jgi:hypothetical protein